MKQLAVKNRIQSWFIGLNSSSYSMYLGFRTTILRWISKQQFSGRRFWRTFELKTDHNKLRDNTTANW